MLAMKVSTQCSNSIKIRLEDIVTVSNNKDDSRLFFSKRNVPILNVLGFGVITDQELKEICFRRDDKLDYRLFMRKKDRDANKRAADPFTSHQHQGSKMKKLEENMGFVISTVYNEISEIGMPIHHKVYALTEFGKEILCETLGRDERNVRYGLPANIHMSHELNLSRIIRKIYSDTQRSPKPYNIDGIYSDRVLRSDYFRTYGSLPQKGTHFPDLGVYTSKSNGENGSFLLELANKKKDKLWWRQKFLYFWRFFRQNLILIANGSDIYNFLLNVLVELQPSDAVYLTLLTNFLRDGLATPTWKKIFKTSVNDVTLSYFKLT
jgi:hypothetical protein